MRLKILAVVLMFTIPMLLVSMMLVATSSTNPKRITMAPADAVVYAGPTTNERAELTTAVKAAQADATARWYAWASQLPAPTPAARPAPSVRSSSAASAPRGGGDAEAAIAKYFGDIYDSAYGVARCESGLNPGAISPGGGNWGLFQINTSHRADFEAYTGHPWNDVLNADLNAMYARKLYDGSGWGPWSCRWAA